MNKIYISSFAAPSGNSGLHFSPIAAAVLSDGSLVTSYAATEPDASAELAELKVLELLCERQNFGEFAAYTDSEFLVNGWQSRRKLLRTRRHADVWKRVDARAGAWLNIELVAQDSELITEAKKQAARLIARGLPRDVGVAFVDDIMRSQGRVML